MDPFYLATPIDALYETMLMRDRDDDETGLVPTVRDGSLTKKEFFASLTEDQLNRFKAMAFDVIMEEIEKDDGSTEAFYDLVTLVQDVINDKQSFYWPAYVKPSREPEAKKIKQEEGE